VSVCATCSLVGKVTNSTPVLMPPLGAAAWAGEVVGLGVAEEEDACAKKELVAGAVKPSCQKRPTSVKRDIL